MSHCRSVRNDKKYWREYRRSKPCVIKHITASIEFCKKMMDDIPVHPDVQSLLAKIDASLYSADSPLLGFGEMFKAKRG